MVRGLLCINFAEYATYFNEGGYNHLSYAVVTRGKTKDPPYMHNRYMLSSLKNL